MKDEQYSITVIVPYYKQERKITLNMLDSISQQTIIDNIQVIFIDDCGDGLINEYLKEYSFDYIVLHNKENLGPGGSRCVGQEHAVGKYIFFLDSDDMIANADSLEMLLSFATEHDADICSGILKWRHKYDGQYVIKQDEYPQDGECLTIANSTHKGNLFKREFLEKNNYKFSGESFFFEEFQFMYPIQKNSNKRVFHLNYDVYIYSPLPNSDSITSTTSDWLGIIREFNNELSAIKFLCQNSITDVEIFTQGINNLNVRFSDRHNVLVENFDLYQCQLLYGYYMFQLIGDDVLKKLNFSGISQKIYNCYKYDLCEIEVDGKLMNIVDIFHNFIDKYKYKIYELSDKFYHDTFFCNDDELGCFFDKLQHA